MNITLVIIFGVLLLAICLAILSKKGKEMNLEEWSVGGRNLGSALVFFLVAGEMYTTFTLLGGSGWAYGKGGPSFYIMAYLSLEYIMAFFLFPVVWEYGKKHRLVTQPDLFVSKYNSPLLGVLVTVVGVIAMVPFLVVQFQGLGILVSVASYGSISNTAAVWIGGIAVGIYVMISGIHGSAWTAVLKDILIIFVVVFLGIYLPIHYYDGLAPMFEAIHAAKPGFLTIPDKGFSESWFISTVMMNVIGGFMWPHVYGAIYSAKGKKALRKNAAVMPLYTLMLLFVLFAGFAAVLQIPGLKNPDFSLLELSVKTFDPWFVGVIGAVGLLTALVPGSVLLMSIATLLSKNVYKVFVPTATDNQVSRLAKFIVPIFSLIGIYYTLNEGQTIVILLLVGFSVTVQLAPSLFSSFMKNNFVTKQGAASGIIVGCVIVAYLNITKTSISMLFPSFPQVMKDINIGIFALIVNIIVTVIVSLLTKNASLSKREVVTPE
ncbi:sodium:solute symporter family protein [Brevibacillus nitrificans]|uniref:sodium:solute symporter family protein n=1 Tax=Brevibacillus nitrificans TaxID=651560 RepID=UPI0026209825|nr:sodium:solute symporter family protein [Brevibacillus nitrificans]MED1796967.1 sodium:solute symporter family protein [Brevibacillus nitrificans]